jgi:hypothetical protein
MTFSFKCICGVTITSDSERQLFVLLKRHSQTSEIHVAQGWKGHKGYGDGGE